jgi:hypothetical protein
MSDNLNQSERKEILLPFLLTLVNVICTDRYIHKKLDGMIRFIRMNAHNPSFQIINTVGIRISLLTIESLILVMIAVFR